MVSFDEASLRSPLIYFAPFSPNKEALAFFRFIPLNTSSRSDGPGPRERDKVQSLANGRGDLCSTKASVQPQEPVHHRREDGSRERTKRGRAERSGSV